MNIWSFSDKIHLDLTFENTDFGFHYILNKICQFQAFQTSNQEPLPLSSFSQNKVYQLMKSVRSYIKCRFDEIWKLYFLSKTFKMAK